MSAQDTPTHASQPAVYTHGHHRSVLRSHSWRTAENSAAYLIPAFKPDMTVLDIGCGPGTITLDFATLVSNGRVVGLDAAAGVLDGARALATERGVKNVEFVTGDATALAFADGTFDIVHAHQVLQHVGDPVRVLSEMRRVTKPGGIVAARDADFAAMAWYPESVGMTEWLDLYHKVTNANGGEADAGRRLLAWARQAGFAREQVTCTAGTWCFSTKEERDWWGGLWAERLVQSQFATTAREHGIATQEDLERVSQAWKEWAASEDGWFSVIHGEIQCRV